MRVFAISDLHLDYSDNALWLSSLSKEDYKEDALILAGDISDSLELIEWCFELLTARFQAILFVPGNHDLWVIREKHTIRNSMEKFGLLCKIADHYGVLREPFHSGPLSIVPLLSWYDYSFGAPAEELRAIWMDYRACTWPEGNDVREIASCFAEMNEGKLNTTNRTVISFSHFVPRIDVMPSYIPKERRVLYPVLGTELLEKQIRSLRPAMHVYGHSHVNRRVPIEGVCYINNAFGYPGETRITAKQLLCIWKG
jgi:predicted phosphodiesterase